MKPPKFLKFIINISYFFLFLELLIRCVCFVGFIFNGKVNLYFLNYLDAFENAGSSSAATVLFSLDLFYTAILFYILYIIKKLIKDFEKESLYTKLQVSGLSLTGKLLVAIVILRFITDFFTTLVVESRLEIKSSFENDLGNPWLLIAVGLFLIYLSKIFANSARLKAENELTV